MKLYFIITICCLVAASIANTSQDKFLRNSFESLKTKFGKVYTSLEENNMRFRIYYKNLKMIEKHNAEYQMGLHTYDLGINQFIDWTEEEIRKFNNVKYHPMPQVINSTSSSYSAALSENLDWREYNYVSRVQNQGQCGSCWAFSATGGIEGAYAKKHLKIINMSDQELLDCDDQSYGCNGGFVNTAFEAAKALGGEVREESYPYQGYKGQCRTGGLAIAAEVTGYQHVGSSEQALKEAVSNHGPISTLINGNPIMYYGKGIFTEHCPHDLTHAVLLVGYGVENGVDYWLIKNSWGPGWGESGYLRLGRNMGQLCGISTWSAYPLVA